MIKHLIIPDCQVKPGVDLSHLSWIGQYIIRKKPEVIVCIGDFADMESLSSYDKGKKSFEGRRYKADIAAAKAGMDLLLNPMREYNQNARKGKHAQYKPRMIMVLGNHEQRIERVSEYQPEFDGVVSYDDLPYTEWEVIPYLKPIVVDGISYVHYLANPFSGKPYGGSPANQLAKVGNSFIVGHKQTLEITTRFTLDGKQQWGIIAGACYLHDESFKGPQGNAHWRGIILAHRVIDGSFDPCFISLDYLKERFDK
jgi:hypothetical protein